MFRLKKKREEKKSSSSGSSDRNKEEKKKECEHRLRRNGVRQQLAGKILTADIIDGSLGEKP